MTDDEDDLEQRKQDMWSMEEVRGGGSSTADTEPADTAATEERSDTADTVESTATSSAKSPKGERIEQSGPSEQADRSEPSDTADPSPTAAGPDQHHAEGETVRQMAIDAEAKGLAVRDLHNVNVYLYESIYREMVATFKELDTKYYQQHGDDLSKNKDFFNAVFRAGLNSPQLQEELELD